jgi:hypothetical protein
LLGKVAELDAVRAGGPTQAIEGGVGLDRVALRKDSLRLLDHDAGLQPMLELCAPPREDPGELDEASNRDLSGGCVVPAGFRVARQNRPPCTDPPRS